MAVYEICETDPGRRGEAYGFAARDLIRLFLDDGLAQVNRLRRVPLAQEEVMGISRQFLAVLHDHLPGLGQEVLGLARGADITPEQAMLLQIRRELTGWGEDCTTLAFIDPEEGGTIAQTIDLSGDLRDYLCALRYRGATEHAGDILMWAYTGLLGYAGINSHGLAVGINMVIGGVWRVGVPPYLLVRQLLGKTSIEACLEEIVRIPRASSRSLTLAQGGRLLIVEMTVLGHRVLEGSVLTHCNHFLHPDFTGEEQVSSQSTTYLRTQVLDSALSHDPRLDIARARILLADHTNSPASICAHGREFKQGKTVSALVMSPAKGDLQICFGKPCSAPFERFSL
ncbi:hypothetical protein PS862_02672 [Pseudomonas fluorescens]|uniref:Peptidase C45 hydrolase domain-containing protein n=1 Tax=Pseudomonas fluorescens TaxID=294 RepID=A0A5E7KAD1_PSEFL|nr:C45 family peptidase [Pseudomonas fluorescens]VVM92290.1 hypothetical protein PS639_02843 [Pseudomonas fluorescens]VVO97600.1 hypothetical protein PS862_02672 [Pseudomonas fluorescens]